MKVGFIADVHSNVYGLSACVKDLFKRRAELILCEGDVVGYYPLVNEAIHLIRESKVITILGNHDVYLLQEKDIAMTLYPDYAIDWTDRVITPENRAFLQSCSENYHTEIDGITLAMFHGSPWSKEDYIYPDYKDFARFTELKEAIVILGHTHHPMLKAIPGGPLVVNSGSCGQPRDRIPLASYALLDTIAATVSIFRVGYDIDALAKATASAGLPRRNIDILYRKSMKDFHMDISAPQFVEVVQHRKMNGRMR
jgi:predicted phosphodiesterase